MQIEANNLSNCDHAVNHALSQVLREIEKIKRIDGKIFIIEYGRNPLHESILKAVDGYKKLSFLVKRDLDGSEELFAKLSDEEEFPKEIRVCGVYTLICVTATVTGLSMKLLSQNKSATISVLANACSSDNNHAGRVLHLMGLDVMQGLKNVKIIDDPVSE